MIGIVLWSDPADSKAVFWCEDQGDLAYYEGTQMDEGQQDGFHAGDMVQFDVTADQTMRLAHDPRLLQMQACTDLPETLRRSVPDAAPNGPQSAHIIPFVAKKDDAPKRLSARNA